MSLSTIGTIPARLAELPLRTVRLQYNQLTGRIPANVLSNTMVISASHNLLTGSHVLKGSGHKCKVGYIARLSVQ